MHESRGASGGHSPRNSAPGLASVNLERQAIINFARYHRRRPEDVSIAEVRSSPGGIAGWAMGDEFATNPQSSQDRDGKRRGKRRRSFLEVLLRKLQKPEVTLLIVWWFIMLVLVIYMAEMGPLLFAIWRPVFLLVAVPMVFLGLMALVSA